MIGACSGCGRTGCYLMLYYPREERVPPLRLCVHCGPNYEAARERGLGWRDALKEAVRGGR